MDSYRIRCHSRLVPVVGVWGILLLSSPDWATAQLTYQPFSEPQWVEIARLVPSRHPVGIALSPNGDVLVAWTYDALQVWDVGSRKIVLERKYPDHTILTAKVPSKQEVITATVGEKRFRIRNALSNETIVDRPTRHSNVIDAQLSHDGKIGVYVTQQRSVEEQQDAMDTMIDVVDIPTGEGVSRIRIAGAAVSAVAISPTAEFLAIAKREIVSMYKVADGSWQGQFRKRGVRIRTLCFAPSGRYLVALPGQQDFGPANLVSDLRGYLLCASKMTEGVQPVIRASGGVGSA